MRPQFLNDRFRMAASSPFSFLITGRQRCPPGGSGGVDIGATHAWPMGSFRRTATLSGSPIECRGSPGESN
ncbi:unnamed protein product [Lota lota]